MKITVNFYQLHRYITDPALCELCRPHQLIPPCNAFTPYVARKASGYDLITLKSYQIFLKSKEEAILHRCLS